MGEYGVVYLVPIEVVLSAFNVSSWKSASSILAFCRVGVMVAVIFSAASAILSSGASSLVACIYCSSLSMVSEMMLMRRWVSQHEAFIVWESASARCRIVQRVFLSFAMRLRSFASTVAWVR